MQPTPINPYDFQKIIDQYATDVKLLWNPKIERYQVFQTVAPVVELPDGADVGDLRRNRLRLVFTIQTFDGQYRDPDESDVQRMIDGIETLIDVGVKGYEQLADRMEKADDERETSIAPAARDAMMWGAEEMYKIRTQKGILGFK